jgi:murein DD-endopeptidase MepM/ murein hydrolase activator NlpD
MRVRRWPLLGIAIAACDPGVGTGPGVAAPAVDVPSPVNAGEPGTLGTLDDRTTDWQFDGGSLEFELFRRGGHVTQIARNRFATPVVIRWGMTAIANLAPASPTSGVTILPPAPVPFGTGPNVVLAELDQIDPQSRYSRDLSFQAQWGDPRAVPEDYVYRLPFPQGQTFSVLQGFHGTFSHRGSAEFAIDFNCPVATQVLAARPGLVVAANAAAQGSGTSPEWLGYRRTNFVLVQHDDGTLGEYMHLAPSGIQVKPGQRVDRGTPLALSGNTGFSSTPHLHFHVMTAGLDGVTTRSFPFRVAAAPRRIEEPVQGRRYTAWEPTPSR